MADHDDMVIVRAMGRHALAEMMRIRAEIDAVSRLFISAHVAAGSDVAHYRAGDTWAALALAGDSMTEAVGLCTRFLELQVVALRNPMATLAELRDEWGSNGEPVGEAV